MVVVNIMVPGEPSMPAKRKTPCSSPIMYMRETQIHYGRSAYDQVQRDSAIAQHESQLGEHRSQLRCLEEDRKQDLESHKRAKYSCLIDDAMTDAALEEGMFSKSPKISITKQMPDFNYIRKELLKNGANKKLLWTEYWKRAASAAAIP